jgi:hypothetical protein
MICSSNGGGTVMKISDQSVIEPIQGFGWVELEGKRYERVQYDATLQPHASESTGRPLSTPDAESCWQVALLWQSELVGRLRNQIGQAVILTFGNDEACWNLQGRVAVAGPTTGQTAYWALLRDAELQPG